jgi:glutathionylspermidine synthase
MPILGFPIRSLQLPSKRSAYGIRQRYRVCGRAKLHPPFTDSPSWTKDVVYGFTMTQVEQVEEAAGNVESMVYSVVEDVVNSRATLDRLAIPPTYHAAVRVCSQTGCACRC